MRIAVSGSSGRVGQSVVQAIAESSHMLAACLVHHHSPYKGKLVSSLIKCKNVPPTLRFSESIKVDVDVLIDFSVPQNMQNISHFAGPLVVGTTGLTEKEWDYLHDHSLRYPVVYSPNFSLGINLFFHILPLIMNTLPEDTFVALTEIHRKEKRDLPGGTAKQFQKMIPQIKNITSLRQEENCGAHTLTLELENETIQFTHKAKNRIGYAQGALLAAEKSIFLPPALYDASIIIEKTLPAVK